MNARLGRAGLVLGLLFAVLLSARVVQVQVFEPGREGVAFAVVYSALLFIPWTLAAFGFVAHGTARRALWIASGVVACLEAFTLSLAGAVLPFLIPAVLLIVAASSRRSQERPAT